jgi:hypothetical protein
MLGRRAARRGVGRRGVGRKAVRRRRGRTLLGAAAVGGAGYYAGKKISEGRQEDYLQDQQIADLQDQTAAQQAAAYAPPPAPDPAAGSDTIAQLQQLTQLHDSGALTDEEFTSAKQKLLSGG